MADISGKPMLQHVWEQASRSFCLDDLFIACDDQRIVAAVEGFGGKVILTVKEHTCGTERICEAVNDIEATFVINIQANEPLIRPEMIDNLARILIGDPSILMATLAKKIEDPREIIDPQVVKIVLDNKDFALYFSRSPIPNHASHSSIKKESYYKQIGLYGYRKDFLFTFKDMPVSDLEKREQLEQLRAIQGGFHIKVVETKYETVSVNTPENLERVRKIFKYMTNDKSGI